MGSSNTLGVAITLEAFGIKIVSNAYFHVVILSGAPFAARRISTAGGCGTQRL